MKLKQLIEKLQGKPNQEAEVEFLVYEKEDGAMVCCDLTAPSTTDLIRLLGKRKQSRTKNPTLG